MNPDSFGVVAQNEKCEEAKNMVNPFRERLKFTCYKFTEERSFDEHIQFLKQLASKCDFGDETEWYIINKILKEYNDPAIFEQLQKEESITLNTLLGLIRAKEKLKIPGIVNFLIVCKNTLNSFLSSLQESSSQEFTDVSKQLNCGNGVLDHLQSYKKCSKESINKVIDISLPNFYTLNEVQDILEIFYDCSLGQDDMTYIQSKYVEQLIELWLDEVSLNTINMFNLSSLSQFLDDVSNIKDFQACLNLALNTPYNKLLKDLFSKKVEIFTESLKRNGILKFKSTIITFLLLQTDLIQNEIKFLQTLIRCIKVSTNVKQLLNLISATQFSKSINNEKLAFKKFLQDVMNCSSAEILMMQLKNAAGIIINQEEFFVIKHVKDIVRDYLKPVEVTKSYKDGRLILEISGKHIVFSEVLPKILSERNFAEIEEVRIVRAGVFHINKSLDSSTWNGKNIIVHSETVIISSNQKISWNFSGRDAEDRRNEAETSSYGVGLDGEDGKPGESGGNALFICDELENADNFQIIVNGGKGGKGQDGGKGNDGEDGDYIGNYDFKNKFPPVSKFYDSEKLKNLEITKSSVMENIKSVQVSFLGMLKSISKDSFDEIFEEKIHPLCKSSDIYFEVITFTGCKILFSFYYGPIFTYCQSFLLYKGADGKPGKPGGKGGRGGKGGYSGDVVLHVSHNSELVNERVIICNSKGDDGKPGEPGEPGKPGKSGQDSAYIDSTKMMKETLFLSHMHDNHKLNVKYHDKEGSNRVYCPHNGWYAEITKSKKNFYETCNMTAPSIKVVGEVQRESVQAVRKKTINSKSVLAQYECKTSAMCLTTENIEQKIKEIYEQLQNNEAELQEQTSKKSKISLKIELCFDNQYVVYQSPQSLTSVKTASEDFSFKDQLMNMNLSKGDFWKLLSETHLSLKDFTTLWDYLSSLPVSLSENEVKFLIQGKYHLAVLEYLHSVKMDAFYDDKWNSCENVVGSVNHCLTLSDEKGSELPSEIDRCLCEDSHESSKFWIQRLESGECNHILLEILNIFLEENHIFPFESEFEMFKTQLNWQKITKIEAMNCKLIPILNALSKVQGLHDKLVEAITKKDIQSMIAIENYMNSDVLLKILYEKYKRTVRAPLKWNTILELQNIVDEIKRKTISSVLYREILARSFNTNILLYSENESNQMVLTHNHNSSASASIHLVMKNNRLFKLKVDEGLSKMNKVFKKKNETCYNILLYLDSLIAKEQFDLFLKEMPFNSPVCKSMEIKLKVKHMKVEDENIQLIINKFEQEEDRILIQSRLNILKHDYTGYQSILYYMALHMRYEGNHITVSELCCVINSIFKSLIEVPSKTNLVLWIIATNQQSNWLMEFILYRLELYLKQLLKEKIKTNWRDYLRKSNKEMLIILSEKIDEDQSIGLKVNEIGEVLYLLSFIPNVITTLSKLKLSDWKYVLKDSFWIIKVKSIGNWSEDQLREVSFYFMNLEHLFGSDMCENFLEMVKNQLSSDETDDRKLTVVTVLRCLTQNEISFVKNVMDRLCNQDINQWGESIEAEHSSSEIRSVGLIRELMENNRNNSESIRSCIDETVMSVKITRFLVKFLISKIEKHELEQWIGSILNIFPRNKIPLFCKQESQESNQQLGSIRLDEKLKDFLKEMIENMQKEMEKSGINVKCPKQINEIKDKFQNERVFLSAHLNEIFMAFLCRSIYHVYGVNLRDTQLLAILTFLNSGSNVLGQVSTGEGKSLIIISIAIMRALSGSKIDIITSSHVLAKRDAEANKEICKLFHIEVGHNCSENIEERKEVYSNCKVVYGELAYYQRDYLLDKVYNENVLSDRTFETVIVDEVDSMLLDKGNNVLYLSHEIPGLDKLEPLFVHIWKCLNFPQSTNKNSMLHIGQLRNAVLDEIYDQVKKEYIMSLDNRLKERHVCQIWNYLQDEKLIDSKGKILQRNFEKVEMERTDNGLDEVVRNYINKGHLKYLWNKIINRKKAFEIPNYLKQFAEDHLNEWIESAINAMNLKINIDYVVDVNRADDCSDINPNIIIVDRDTGTDMKNSQWDQGLHQFLQLKHGCRISPLTFKAVFISNVKYLQQYQTLYGLTGTLGSKIDRKLLRDTYNVEFVTIPTAKAKVFIQEIPILCSNREDWSNALFKEVHEITATRAALIVCESVKDVLLLKKHFDMSLKNQSSKREVVTYTRDYEEFSFDEKNSLKPGHIIISTNLAGRGTDIKLSPKLVNAGGLHVCLSFLPSNCRVEEQAFGRAARNGEPGSGRLIFMKPGHSTSSKLFDVVKERDINEVFRINEVERHYKSKIKVEEDWFCEFKNTFSALRGSKHPDQIKSILLMTCLNQWAIWLERETKSGIKSSLKSLLADISELVSDEFKIWSNQIHDPFQLTKLGLLYLKQKDYELAIKLFNKVIENESVFSEAAYYYRISANSCVEDIESITVVKELEVVEQKLKERVESSLVSGRYIDMMKNSIKKNVLQIDSFQEQQITVCKTYGTFIDSIQNIIGSPVTPESFIGSSIPLQGISEERVSHQIFNDLIEHEVLNVRIKDDISNEDLNLLTEFGINHEKVINMLMMFKNENNLTISNLLNNIHNSLSLHLPSRELFWSELVDVGVLKSEVELVSFNFERLKEVDPSFEKEIQKLSSCIETPSKDQISLYTREELGVSDKFFSYPKVLKAVGKDRLEFLKRENVIQMNKVATFVHPLGANAIKFNYFDSISQGDFVKVGIPDEIAACIVKDLVDCNVISLEENEDNPQYSLIIWSDEIDQVDLQTNKFYLNDVKQLLSHCFAFRIAFEKLLDVLPSCEGNYNVLFLPLQANLDQLLLGDLLNYGIVEIRTNSEKVNSECLRKIYFSSATREKFIEIFSKVYDHVKCEEIVDELIKSNCLKKSIISLNDLFKINYENGKKEIKLISLPENLEADIETIKLILLKQIYLSLSVDIINIRLELLNGKIYNVETPMLSLTSLEQLLNQRKIPTTEVHLFTLNGFDEVIDLKNKTYTTRMIWNTSYIMALGLVEISVGVFLEICFLENPLGMACIAQGVDDIVFATSCAVTGHFSWKDYRTNKLISLLLTSFSFYRALKASFSAIQNSSFAVKTAGISFSTFKEKCCSLLSRTKNVFKSMFQRNVSVSNKEVLVGLSKRVVVSVGQAAAAGATMSIMDHVVRERMDDLEELLTDLIHSDIDKTVRDHKIIQDAKELYYTQGGEESKKIIGDVMMKVTLAFQTELDKVDLNSIKTLITRLTSREFRALFGKGDGNHMTMITQFTLAAENLYKSISSVWAQVKIIKTIVSDILNKAHQELQTEKNHSNKLKSMEQDLTVSRRNEEHYISENCEIIQTCIRNTMKDHIRDKFLLPILELIEPLFMDYSFKFIGHMGKSFLSDEEISRFSHKHKDYPQQNFKSEAGKSYVNVNCGFHQLSRQLMKTRRIKAVMRLSMVNNKNAPVNLNCLEFCFKMIPLILQQEGVTVPPIKFVFEENGKKRMFEFGNTNSETRVVYISQDEDFTSNLMNNKLLMKDVFEYLNKQFLEANPELQNLSAAIMYEIFIRVIDNLSTLHKSSEEEEERSFPSPCGANLLNNDTEKRNPYQHSHCDGSWKFNPNSDVDIRERYQTVNLNNPQHHIVKGFKFALKKINNHIHLIQECFPSFDLCLDDFSVTKHQVTPPLNDNTLELFHCFPIQYELVVPLMLTGCNRLVDFSILLRLVNQKPSRMPQPNCPNGPHIFYEINPSSEVKFINKGLRGHILLNINCTNTSYSIKECHVAGELIVASLKLKSKHVRNGSASGLRKTVNKKDHSVVIITDSRFKNIRKHIKLPKNSYDCLVFPSCDNFENFVREVKTSLKNYQNIKCVVLFFGNDLLKRHKVNDGELVSCLIGVIDEIQKLVEKVHIVLYSLLYVKYPAMKLFWTIFETNRALETYLIEEFTLKNTNEVVGPKDLCRNGIDLKVSGYKKLGKHLSEVCEATVNKKGSSKQDHFFKGSTKK